jgi:hypothetical protein
VRPEGDAFKEPPMAGAQRVTQEEIQALPRWARLAFAARCVRRAQQLLSGPDEPPDVIDRALTLAEQATWRGQAGDQLADAAAAAYTLALNAVDATTPAAEEDDSLIVTCTVAHAAAFAAEAATVAVARMAAYLAAQSVDFALQAHIVACPDQVPEVIEAMRQDLEALQDAVLREGWGNLSPMPVDFFE